MPSDPRSEHELGGARNQLENFHLFEIEDLTDGGDHLVEVFLQIAFRQCAFAQARKRFLLARTHADLAIDAQAFGHISTQAEHLHSRAVLDDDGDQRFEPTLLAPRSTRQAVLQAARLARLQALADRGENACRVLRRKVLRGDR